MIFCAVCRELPVKGLTSNLGFQPPSLRQFRRLTIFRRYMLHRNMKRAEKVIALISGRFRWLKVGVCSGVTVQLPIQAHRSYWRGDHPDLPLLEFLAGAFPSEGAYFDIGANVGVYAAVLNAMTMARGGRFRALEFEPIPSTIPILRQTLALNNVEAQIEQVALSDQSGELLMSCYDRGGNNFWLKEEVEGIPSIRVRRVPLDNWINENPNVVPAAMKIDVEGHELAVLEGAYQTLSRHRPRLCIECHCASWPALGVSARRMDQLLRSLGYRSCTTRNGHPPDLQHTHATTHVLCHP
jgi:FkbM family methyltransferase